MIRIRGSIAANDWAISSDPSVLASLTMMYSQAG